MKTKDRLRGPHTNQQGQYGVPLEGPARVLRRGRREGRWPRQERGGELTRPAVRRVLDRRQTRAIVISDQIPHRRQELDGDAEEDVSLQRARGLCAGDGLGTDLAPAYLDALESCLERELSSFELGHPGR